MDLICIVLFFRLASQVGRWEANMPQRAAELRRTIEELGPAAVKVRFKSSFGIVAALCANLCL